jgi:hypothetical protein
MKIGSTPIMVAASTVQYRMTWKKEIIETGLNSVCRRTKVQVAVTELKQMPVKDQKKSSFDVGFFGLHILILFWPSTVQERGAGGRRERSLNWNLIPLQKLQFGIMLMRGLYALYTALNFCIDCRLLPCTVDCGTFNYPAN